MSLAFRKELYKNFEAKKAFKLLKKPVVWKPQLYDGLRKTEHVLKTIINGPKTRKQIWEALKGTNCGFPSVKKLSKMLASLMRQRRIKSSIDIQVSTKHYTYTLIKRNGKNDHSFANIKAGQQVGPKVHYFNFEDIDKYHRNGKRLFLQNQNRKFGSKHHLICSPKDITSLPIEKFRKDGKAARIPYQV